MIADDDQRVPRRLWDEMLLALDQSLARIEALDPEPSIVTQQVHAFGQRVLTEARRVRLPARR